MRRALGWMCWQIVMRWPGAWPSGTAAAWILAWAGDYANETPNLSLSANQSDNSITDTKGRK